MASEEWDKYFEKLYDTITREQQTSPWGAGSDVKNPLTLSERAAQQAGQGYLDRIRGYANFIGSQTPKPFPSPGSFGPAFRAGGFADVPGSPTGVGLPPSPQGGVVKMGSGTIYDPSLDAVVPGQPYGRDTRFGVGGPPAWSSDVRITGGPGGQMAAGLANLGPLPPTGEYVGTAGSKLEYGPGFATSPADEDEEETRGYTGTAGSKLEYGPGFAAPGEGTKPTSKDFFEKLFKGDIRGAWEVRNELMKSAPEGLPGRGLFREGPTMDDRFTNETLPPPIRSKVQPPQPKPKPEPPPSTLPNPKYPWMARGFDWNFDPGLGVLGYKYNPTPATPPLTPPTPIVSTRLIGPPATRRSSRRRGRRF